MELPYANPEWAQYCVSSAPFRLTLWRLAKSRIFKYCVPAGWTSRPAYWGGLAGEHGFLSGL